MRLFEVGTALLLPSHLISMSPVSIPIRNGHEAGFGPTCLCFGPLGPHKLLTAFRLGDAVSFGFAFITFKLCDKDSP